MRVTFYAEGEDEKHIFTVEEMDAPLVGDIVWINAPGPRSESLLPPKYRGHKQCEVVRRSFSIQAFEGADGRLFTGARAEILLRVKEGS